MNPSLPLDALFSAANTLALACWLALTALPRRPLVRRLVQASVVGVLCCAYTVLIFAFFFRADGGFFSLPAVQRLFDSPPVALAGWIHYLAFDLFVGLWIAQRADASGLSRWIQAPILLTTFMFGPIGLLLFVATQAAASRTLAR